MVRPQGKLTAPVGMNGVHMTTAASISRRVVQ